VGIAIITFFVCKTPRVSSITRNQLYHQQSSSPQDISTQDNSNVHASYSIELAVAAAAAAATIVDILQDVV
jgi:hypothetical protein